MPIIHFLDLQNVVSSVDNSTTEIVMFVCPQLYGTAHLRNTVIPIDYSIFVPPSLDLFIHLCGLTKYLRLFVPELL